MNSKERILAAINHKQPDKLPVDFGSTDTTGMYVSVVYKLRQYFGLDEPGTPVKVIELMQMTGDISDDLKDIIGVDVSGIPGQGTIFGFDKKDWKEWKLFDGTPVLVPGLFNTEADTEGNVCQYPQGDKSCLPGGKMPCGGFYFDPIIRNKIANTDNPDNNIEEYNVLSKEEITYLKEETVKLYDKQKYGIVKTIECSGFGDLAFITGVMLKEPKGIRDIEEWYISHYSRKDYIKKMFEKQCEIVMENCRRIWHAADNKIDVVDVASADFGNQKNLIFPLETYQELYKPFHKKVNEWIHNNTNWKTFIHSCGAIYKIIPDLIDAGFDILNPVQISAEGMEPARLKKEFGKYLTFWGGGVDTQKTLPFGTPKEVKEEVKRLIDIFSRDGGYVFNAVHNIQPIVPVENIIAMIEVIRDYRK